MGQPAQERGIVSSNELIEFFDWSLDSGPQVNDTVDLWLCIEDDLIKENVPAAAAQLRHGSEHFFAEVCDHLHANVEYKLSGRYELGDFIHPAMDAFRSIIKQGIKAAKSWGEDIETELKLLEKEQGKKQPRLQEKTSRLNSNCWIKNEVLFTLSLAVKIGR